jgi:hypothetical protein
MTSVPTILLGEVTRDAVTPGSEDSREILFEKPMGVARPENKAEAILLVLEPDESPWEVAEMVRWALRVATQRLQNEPLQNARLPVY